MTNAQAIHWAIIYLRALPFPEGPQAAAALITVLDKAVQFAHGYDREYGIDSLEAPKYIKELKEILI